MSALDALWSRLSDLGVSALSALPMLAIAAVLLLVFYVVSRAIRALGHRLATRNGRTSGLGMVIGRLGQAAVMILGIMIAATVVFPSFAMGDLVEVLGLASVALGFAFRDILQNFLAGILILWTRPFVLNDQIVFKEFEGTVTEIQTRATIIRTYDGRRIVIPNSELFTNAVTVNTAYESRRMEHDIGIGVGDDIDKAREIILSAVRGVDGVLADPAPDVCVVDLADFSIKLRVRWWIAPPRRADVVEARDAVLGKLKTSLLSAGIDLPYPTTQILFHDQTEETDGDRRKQREGWPAGNGASPRPRFDIATGDNA